MRIISDDSNDGFWTGYFRVLAEEGLPEKQRPYYAQWVKRLFQSAGASGLGRERVDEFLHRLTQDSRVAGWQALQAVEATRLALCRAGRSKWGEWARQIDWAAWRERMKSLERVHPTRMRSEVRNEEWAEMETKWRRRRAGGLRT